MNTSPAEAGVTDGTRCPCLSGLAYGECCAPLHRGERVAPTAVQLMRSRYSAFAIGDVRYLLATWHPTTRPTTLELDAATRWYRLAIIATMGGGPLESNGTVEFVAFYRTDGDRGSQRELSRFTRERGRWFYLDAAP